MLKMVCLVSNKIYSELIGKLFPSNKTKELYIIALMRALFIYKINRKSSFSDNAPPDLSRSKLA